MAQTVKNLPAVQETQVRSLRQGSLDPRVPWRRKWQPITVSLPGELHGQRSLMSYSPWGCKESDTTEWLHTFTYRVQVGVGEMGMEKMWLSKRARPLEIAPIHSFIFLFLNCTDTYWMSATWQTLSLAVEKPWGKDTPLVLALCRLYSISLE